MWDSKMCIGLCKFSVPICNASKVGELVISLLETVINKESLHQFLKSRVASLFNTNLQLPFQF